jgi:lysozyme
MTYAEAFEQLISAIKRFEGCRLRAYKCPAGVWTIGYGETLGVKEGDVWTQEQADARLKQRVFGFMQGVVKRCPKLLLEPLERWIACTDLAYNIGTGAFGASSVCRHTTRGEFDAAARAFLLWNKAGGRVLKGLTVRRQWDKSTFLRVRAAGKTVSAVG